MPILDTLRLKQWFSEKKRDFPWRTNISPYGVWISEVMLQQTRAEVVVPYFLKWMNRYPNIQSLAESSLEEVIKHWEGLGYYSRARNLLGGAKQILSTFNGNLPKTESELLTIKGLGPYTVNAILSFAFHKKAIPLDGNMIRVLTRYFADGNDISKPQTINNLREIGKNLLPEDHPWIVAEALIELGATLCSKKPTCCECPIKEGCQSFKKGDPLMFPYKSKKIAITPLKRAVGVFLNKDCLLVKKSTKGIMADLYEFPYITIEEALSQEQFQEKIEETFPLKITTILPLSKQKQSFTRFRAELFPYLCNVIPHEPIDEYQWLPLEHLREAAFSSGHRRIFSTIF